MGKLKPTLLTFPLISLPSSGLQVDPREPYIIASSYIFSSFPHRLSHIINYVDCFGANGSGFTNYDDMPYTIRKSAENYNYQSIDDLVNRLQVIFLPGNDKVTFIMNRISGLTCKVQNLVSYKIRKIIQISTD